MDLKPYLYEIARLCRVTIEAIDRVFEAYPPESQPGYAKMDANATALNSVYIALNAGARIGNFLDAPAPRKPGPAGVRSDALRQAVGDPDLPIIADREARHSVEHYDERLDAVRSRLEGLKLQGRYFAAESIVLSEMHQEDSLEFPYRVFRFPLMPASLIFPLRVYEMNSGVFFTIEDVRISLHDLKADTVSLLSRIEGDQRMPFFSVIGPQS